MSIVLYESSMHIYMSIVNSSSMHTYYKQSMHTIMHNISLYTTLEYERSMHMHRVSIIISIHTIVSTPITRLGVEYAHTLATLRVCILIT